VYGLYPYVAENVNGGVFGPRSLIGLYLMAMWLATDFGRPFQ
jgi:hypothetical protein